MMRQSVSFAPPATRNVYGELAPGAATTYRCRHVQKQRLVLNDEGQQVLSKSTLYVMGNPTIPTESQVTLSTGDVGSTENYAIHPPILSVCRYPDDGGGFHHTVVYLG
jgi:hypothetical protein